MLNFFKKLIKNKFFWIGLVIVIVLVIVGLNVFKGKQTTYVTEKVQKGDIVQTVSETGTVESAGAIDLNFKTSGNLTELDVKAGDQVTKGQVLAKLETKDPGIQVRQAQASLDVARASLNKLLSGASSQDIKVTQENANNAQIAYDNAKRNHEALLSKLDSDIKTYEQAVPDRQDNLTTALESSLAMADHALDVIEVIFNDIDLKAKFSVENFQYKTDADYYYDQATVALAAANNYFSQTKSSQSADDLKKSVDLTLSMLEVLNKSLDNTFLALGASTTNYDFNPLDLASYKSDVKLQQSNTTTSISSIQAADQAWKNAQISLTTALSNKQLTISNSQSTVDSALGAYNLAKAQLDLKIAAPRYADISYYQAQVNQAQAAVDLARKNLDNYIITAPVDGIVTFINYKIGEQVSSGGSFSAGTSKPSISMLGNNQFQIKVDVPESDIVKVKLDDPVEITLDAYGQDVKFNGKVIYIDVAETVIQDVVYYKVTVALDSTDKEIKSGMTANVDIMTAQAKDVLFVPTRAVKETDAGAKYVEILKDGKSVQVNVIVGLKGDQSRTEIASGLQEGQEVIVFKQVK
jgi:HlyD family secretion protein